MEEQVPMSIFEDEHLYQAPEISTTNEALFANKRILALVSPDQHLEEVKENLSKIFDACKVPAEQVLVLNQLVSWSEIQNYSQIKEVFLFGVSPNQLGIFYHIFPYRFIAIENRMLFLADPVAVIFKQTQLKADFWNKSLKPYFLD